MKSKEQELYELIEKLDESNLDGIGIHETSFVETRFPEDAYGYRVYHKEGYCFDITREKDYEDEEDEVGFWTYEYHEGVFDGFKELTLDDAIKLIREEGVFE
ncbi:hypothetical protein [Mesonia mobilis]|mgnify:FL=1|uniref:hypothetical protein n=1 Tax=Mesonia mobilis TaxID=369791 RepID=UPI0026EB1A43|nr:hypothetical protein [Mesonia mobilis]